MNMGVDESGKFCAQGAAETSEDIHLCTWRSSSLPASLPFGLRSAMETMPLSSWKISRPSAAPTSRSTRCTHTRSHACARSRSMALTPSIIGSAVCQRMRRPALALAGSCRRQCGRSAGTSWAVMKSRSPTGSGGADSALARICATSDGGMATAPEKAEPWKNLEPVRSTHAPRRTWAATSCSGRRSWHRSTTSSTREGSACPSSTEAMSLVVKPVLVPTTCRSTHTGASASASFASWATASAKAVAASFSVPSALRAAMVSSSTLPKPGTGMPTVRGVCESGTCVLK
mmetsp:Transcript_51367/g.111748  ORF Transcript_51367/g.111748 Transcript_51367/m.111748 type:complete len:288 (+) Transcript_51367:1231-2094(+)